MQAKQEQERNKEEGPPLYGTISPAAAGAPPFHHCPYYMAVAAAPDIAPALILVHLGRMAFVYDASVGLS